MTEAPSLPERDAERDWGALADTARATLDALLADPRGGVEVAALRQVSDALVRGHLPGHLPGYLPGYRALPPAVEAWLGELPGPAVRARRWALSVHLMVSLPARLRASAFPPSMWDEWLDLAWRALERVQRHPAPQGHEAHQDQEGNKDNKGQAWPEDWDDPWRKDLAALSLRAVPAVSHLLVPGAGVPRAWLLHALLRQPAAALRVLGATRGRRAPFLENHVHPWMLGRFSPEGREACFRQVAQLLRLWPECQGLMGTSWYYDDALAAVSPKLAYLRQVPQAHGAVFWAHAPSAQAARDAALRSPVRRAAIERGAYRPRAVTMLWPRERLLASPWGVSA